MTCNRIAKPEMTKTQIAECEKCKHASGKKIWCCLFGIPIGEPKNIITRPKRIITPDQIRNRPPRPKLTLAKMALDFSKAMLRWAAKGLATVPKAEYIKRRQICQDCQDGWRCRYCGCMIWAKIALTTETCPEGQW